MVNKIRGWKNLKFNDITSLVTIFSSLARLWHQWTYMGTNKKIIKCHGKNEGLSHVIFKQAQGRYLWDSLLEGEVISWTPPSPVACIIACIIAYTNIVTRIIVYIIINFQLTISLKKFKKLPRLVQTFMEVSLNYVLNGVLIGVAPPIPFSMFNANFGYVILS